MARKGLIRRKTNQPTTSPLFYLLFFDYFHNYYLSFSRFYMFFWIFINILKIICFYLQISICFLFIISTRIILYILNSTCFILIILFSIILYLLNFNWFIFNTAIHYQLKCLGKVSKDRKWALTQLAFEIHQLRVNDYEEFYSRPPQATFFQGNSCLGRD